MKVGSESFIKPSKVVGGASMDRIDQIGKFLGVDNVLCPQRRVQKVGVIGVWGRSLTLRRSGRGTRGVHGFGGSDHGSARVGEGNN